MKSKPIKNRFEVLDGWRGISILCVLAGHLLPLGPKLFELNAAVAATGMAFFFILSGFLITNILLFDKNIKAFLIRRFLRIVPLAWLVLIISLFLTNCNFDELLSHLFFYANCPPITLKAATSHFWSLCVEMQFYVIIAVLVFFLKEKAFYLLPLLCIFVTTNRIIHGVEISVVTYYRGDEILAGCILAILYNRANSKFNWIFQKLNPVYLIPILIISAHPKGHWICYLRPYLAMTIIGTTLFREKLGINKILKGGFLAYIASISYALYVIHGGLRHTWLGEGDKIIGYLKRPLLFGVTFFLAHLSTCYYEKYWIKLGKKITVKLKESDRSGILVQNPK